MSGIWLALSRSMGDHGSRFGYWWAAASAALVFVITWLAGPILWEPSPYVLFFVPAVVSAWKWGLGPSLVCVLAGTVFGAAFVLPVEGLPGHSRTQDVVEIGVFLVVATAIAALTASLEAARRSAREAVATAEKAVAEREELISIASHELRTPLTALRLALGLASRHLISGDDPSRVRAMTDAADREVSRLTTLLDHMLDLARIRVGQLALSPEPTDLAVVAREVVLRFSPTAEEAGCALSIDAPEPCLGTWDPRRLDQVLTNLVSNAIKYGRGAPVEVSVHQLSAPGHHARVTVRDHGIGIAPSDQARIFERFQRAGVNGRVPGLGLGLFVARAIAEAHGGQLTVSSSLGQGSAFSLTLPR